MNSMKKYRHLFARMIMAACMSLFFVSGCSKEEKEEPNEVEAEEQSNEKSEITDNEADEDVQENVKPEDDSQNPAEVPQETRNVTVYYVDDQTAEVTGKSVEIQDEYDSWNVREESGLVTEDCGLLRLKVDEAAKKLDLDFNSATGDRIRSMGTTGETQIVGCIINTYLEAYGCEGIRLTQEGEAFVTSHGADFDGYSGEMTF